MKRFLCLLAVVCLSSAACGLIDNQDERVVITVGKARIKTEELRKEIRRIAFEMEIPDVGADRVLETLVNRIVDQFLVLEYGREKGISLTEEEVEAAIKEIRRDYGQKDFEEMLLERYIDFKEWKVSLKRRILMEKIVEGVSENMTPVPIQEIKAYFDSHRDEFTRPPAVRFRQVVVKTRSEAEEILKRLEQGEDMGELAREYSIAPSLGPAGEESWIAQGDVDESMEKTVFSLPEGKTSDVVESPYGFHIFQVLAKRPGGIKSLPEAMKEIEAKLSHDRESSFYQAWLKELRARIPVKINEGLLKTMEIG